MRAAAAVFCSALILACVSDRPTDVEVDLGSCTVAVDSIAGETHTIVAIQNFSFVQDTVRIAPGTTVTWVNCEAADIPPHTSTADAGEWSSPLLEPGETYSLRFDQPGAFPYHCEPHPSMQGVVLVD